MELLSAFDKDSLHQFAKTIQTQFRLDWYGYGTLTPLDKEMIGHIVEHMYDYYAVLRIRLDITDYLMKAEGYGLSKAIEIRDKVADEHCPKPSPTYAHSCVFKILFINYRLHKNEWALAALFFIKKIHKALLLKNQDEQSKKIIETTGLSEQELQKSCPSDKEVKAIVIKKSDYKTYEEILEILMTGDY